MISACASRPLARMTGRGDTSPAEIVYLSTDRSGLSVFSKESVRFGPFDLALRNPAWPSAPATYFKPEAGVECVSFGLPGNTEEYAIKRPIVDGGLYKCHTTTFRVIQCFSECQTAVIERERSLAGPNNGSIKSYFYADMCLGVLIISQNSDLTQGVSLDAEWLRGKVGILAAQDYPSCDPLLS